MTDVAEGDPVAFNYTGAAQTYTVPAGVSRLRVVVRGAGGGSVDFQLGGSGAQVSAELLVVPGQVLQVVVGGAGRGAVVGFNGGGVGGSGFGGGGGGASDVRGGAFALADRLVVAGGGGGGGNFTYGGSGGQPVGGNGTGNGSLPGQGGTPTAGGAGGTNVTHAAGNGSLGYGGYGTGSGAYGGNGIGGGGGGGLYGGGGGVSSFGTGGGGSSGAVPTALAVAYGPAGGASTDGSVVVFPLLAPLGDNLGNHTATQNLQLGSNLLVGNGGANGIAVGADGQLRASTTTPAAGPPTG